MTSNFVSPVIGKASELGVDLYEDSQPVELFHNSSETEKEVVIRAVYRQVLGNGYVMESERLSVPESQLKEGTISVRDFVRQVGKSYLYRSRFFDNCPRYRSIELNFKHFLGRAPESYEEMMFHSQLLDENDYEAEIDSYVDSDEYQEKFGDNLVPYYRGYKTQTGKKMVGFTHLFQLLRGASSSDKNLVVGNYSRLTSSLINNSPSAVIPPSSSSSYGGLTDVNKLLANVLKPKPQTAKTQLDTSTISTYQAYLGKANASSLERQYEEQKLTIKQLEEKLRELNSFASISTSQLSKWQSRGYITDISSSASSSYQPISSTVSGIDSQNLQLQVEEQNRAIAALEEKIALAQSSATIGEARLNKWRGRTFS